MKSISLLIMLFGIIFNINGQIRFTEVNTSTESITIKNFGNSSVDISTYQLCVYPSYGALDPMTTNSLSLAAGASVTFTSTINLPGANGELGLYISSPFGTASNMRDYIQWGSSPHQRESVANATSPKIWEAGTFISPSATIPYQYTGDGSSLQNGVAYWDPTLSSEDFSISRFSLSPNPSNAIVRVDLSSSITQGTIKTYNVLGKQVYSSDKISNTKIDVSSWSEGVYFVQVSSLGNTKTKRFVKQ